VTIEGEGPIEEAAIAISPEAALGEPRIGEPLDSRVAVRALEWAARWYPASELAVTGVTDATASVLVEVEGDIRVVRYENLDAAASRCEICGPGGGALTPEPCATRRDRLR
jgi:hypothetical protein